MQQINNLNVLWNKLVLELVLMRSNDKTMDTFSSTLLCKPCEVVKCTSVRVLLSPCSCEAYQRGQVDNWFWSNTHQVFKAGGLKKKKDMAWDLYLRLYSPISITFDANVCLCRHWLNISGSRRSAQVSANDTLSNKSGRKQTSRGAMSGSVWHVGLVTTSPTHS